MAQKPVLRGEVGCALVAREVSVGSTSQWHLARAVGKRFRGCRAKRLYVHCPGKERVLATFPLSKNDMCLVGALFLGGV